MRRLDPEALAVGTRRRIPTPPQRNRGNHPGRNKENPARARDEVAVGASTTRRHVTGPNPPPPEAGADEQSPRHSRRQEMFAEDEEAAELFRSFTGEADRVRSASDADEHHLAQVERDRAVLGPEVVPAGGLPRELVRGGDRLPQRVELSGLEPGAHDLTAGEPDLHSLHLFGHPALPRL